MLSRSFMFTRRLSRCVLALSAGLSLTVAPWVRADDWPQFRGPNCSGISSETDPLPVEFSPEKGVHWSKKIGDGIGCPVVAAGRLFVPTMTDKETVSLLAFDAASGKQLWQRDWPTGKLATIHETNSHASTTPAADGERVYFYFSTLGLLAVDAKTGKDVWQYEMPTPYFVFKWGPGMSPVLYKDLVILAQDDDLYPALYAVDKRTGKLRWKDAREDMAVNYSHPVICTVDGEDEIVLAGTGMLIGYDPSNGKRKWFARTLLRNIKTTPVSFGGVIYISLQSGGIANQWLASIDQVETGNKDGKLDLKEIEAFVGVPIPEAFVKKTFGRGDLDKDGFLAGKELDLAFLHPDNAAGANFEARGDDAADEYIMAVRGGGEGNVTDSHVLWKHRTKYTDHIVSPLVADGRMFLLKCGGITTVFKAQDGSPLRGATRVGNGGDYFGSPIVADGKIYVGSDNGHMLVIKNDADYEVLADNDMGEPVVATPAIAGGSLFVRTRNHIYCLRAK